MVMRSQIQYSLLSVGLLLSGKKGWLVSKQIACCCRMVISGNWVLFAAFSFGGSSWSTTYPNTYRLIERGERAFYPMAKLTVMTDERVYRLYDAIKTWLEAQYGACNIITDSDIREKCEIELKFALNGEFDKRDDEVFLDAFKRRFQSRSRSNDSEVNKGNPVFLNVILHEILYLR